MLGFEVETVSTHVEFPAEQPRLVSRGGPTRGGEVGDLRHVAPGYAREHGQKIILHGTPSLRQDWITEGIAPTLGPDCALPTCSQFLRATATAFGD